LVFVGCGVLSRNGGVWGGGGGCVVVKVLVQYIILQFFFSILGCCWKLLLTPTIFIRKICEECCRVALVGVVTL